MWAAVIRFSALGQWISPELSALPSKNIQAIFHYDGKTFLGTARGVYEYESGLQTVTRIKGLPEVYINTLYIQNDTVFAGTPEGLYIYSLKDGSRIILNREKGLLGDAVTSLAGNEKYLYIASQWGINAYDFSTGRLTPFTYSILDGLPSNNVLFLLCTSSYVFAATDKGVAWKERFGPWLQTEKSSGVSQIQINSLALIKNTLYCASQGAGLFIVNIHTLMTKNINVHSGKIPDDFVLSLRADGEYLWIGTFGGGVQHNVNDETWTAFSGMPAEKNAEKFADTAVNTISIDNNYVFIGTVDYGFAFMDKKVPGIRISPSLQYNKDVQGAPKRVLELSIQAGGKNPLTDVAIGYRDVLIDKPYSKGITVLPVRAAYRNEKAAYICFAENNLLPMLWRFAVTVSIADSKGQKNTAEEIFLYDSETPVLDFLPYNQYTTNTVVRIQGRYRDFTLDQISVYPVTSQPSISINSMFKTFFSMLPLAEGRNDYTFTAEDLCGNAAIRNITLYRDTAAPVVPWKSGIIEVPWENDVLKIPFKEENLDRSRVYVIAGEKRMTADSDLGQSNISVRLNAGTTPVPYTLVLHDLAGNKTEFSFLLKQVHKVPALLLDSDRFFAKEKIYTLTGNAYSSSQLEITVTPHGSVPIKAAYNSMDKVFNAKLTLKKGENVVRINAKNSEGYEANRIVSVFYALDQALQSGFVSIDSTPQAVVPPDPPPSRTEVSEDTENQIAILSGQLARLNRENAELRARTSDKTMKIITNTIVKNEKARNEDEDFFLHRPCLIVISFNADNSSETVRIAEKYYNSASFIEYIASINALISPEMIKRNKKIIIANQTLFNIMQQNTSKDFIGILQIASAALFNNTAERSVSHALDSIPAVFRICRVSYEAKTGVLSFLPFQRNIPAQGIHFRIERFRAVLDINFK